MVVRCYTADVYCDNPECVAPYKEDTSTAAGPNWRSCKRQLREGGWVFGYDESGLEVCICPYCAEKDRKRFMRLAREGGEK